MNKKRKIIIFIILICVIAIYIGINKYNDMHQEDAIKKSTAQRTLAPENNKDEQIQCMFTYDYKNLTLAEILKQYQAENGLNENNFAVSYYNFINKETYHFNELSYMFGASTYKLPLNMYYYELIADGKLDANTSIYYGEDSMEEEYSLIQGYGLYDFVPLSILQYESMVHSNNNASWVLFNGLGGWGRMIEGIQKYALENTTLHEGNYFTSAYMLEVLCYLYEHAKYFDPLLMHMQEAQVESYLKKYMPDVNIAHKYGEYALVNNDVGIVCAKQPYAIAIYTDGLSDGEKVIGEINRIIYEYVMMQ